MTRPKPPEVQPSCESGFWYVLGWPEYQQAVTDALDERDALLAKCAEFLGAAYMDDRRHEAEWALGEEIDTMLERKP